MEAVLPKRKVFVSLLLVFSLLMAFVPGQSYAAVAAKKVKLAKTAVITVGQKVKLKATLSPKRSKARIKWTTSSKKIATVSSKGVVTGKKPGKAKIKATLPNKKYAVCKVTVKKKAVVTPKPTTKPTPKPTTTPVPAMGVKSGGIVNGVIADKYGLRGTLKNGIPSVSLPITVSSPPSGTESYAIVMLDPDCSPAFVHWIAFSTSGKLAENASAQGTGLCQGVNDFGTTGYGGPTPPEKHTYVITVYALNTEVCLAQGFSYTEFKDAIKGHVLKSATVKGTYAP